MSDTYTTEKVYINIKGGIYKMTKEEKLQLCLYLLIHYSILMAIIFIILVIIQGTVYQLTGFSIYNWIVEMIRKYINKK